MKCLALILSIILVFCALAFANEPGVNYDAIFPIIVSLDGDFGDWPSVHWHKITHSMGWEALPESDSDLSCEFACVADESNLYVAIKVWDDVKCVGEDTGNGLFQDDSVEIYIDGDNSKPTEYEPDVCQITIGRLSAGKHPDNPELNFFKGASGRGASAADTGTKAAVVDTQDGWAVEAAIPLSSFRIQPASRAVIGFSIHLNDDDDRGGRDHRLGWSKKELAGEDIAYADPSVFGELKFLSADKPELDAQKTYRMARGKPSMASKKHTDRTSMLAAVVVLLAGSITWMLSR